MNENQKTRNRDNNYFRVYGWMTKLGLSAEEMSVYAIIWNASQAEGQIVPNNVKHLAESMVISEQTVKAALTTLEAKGLVTIKSGAILPTGKKGT